MECSLKDYFQNLYVANNGKLDFIDTENKLSMITRCALTNEHHRLIEESGQIWHILNDEEKTDLRSFYNRFFNNEQKETLEKPLTVEERCVLKSMLKHTNRKKTTPIFHLSEDIYENIYEDLLEIISKNKLDEYIAISKTQEKKTATKYLKYYNKKDMYVIVCRILNYMHIQAESHDIYSRYSTFNDFYNLFLHLFFIGKSYIKKFMSDTDYSDVLIIRRDYPKIHTFICG